MNEISITAHPEERSNICTFNIGKNVHFGETLSCRDKRSADGSPLLEELIEIDGIKQVLLDSNTITIQKNDAANWRFIGTRLAATVRRLDKEGKPFVAKARFKVIRNDSEFMGVQKVIDLEINPGVANHGGKVILVTVKDHSAHLKFSGGCQGCGQVKQTLSSWVDATIKQAVPSIKNIIDVTDHSDGPNPFYKK